MEKAGITIPYKLCRLETQASFLGLTTRAGELGAIELDLTKRNKTLLR